MLRNVYPPGCAHLQFLCVSMYCKYTNITNYVTFTSSSVICCCMCRFFLLRTSALPVPLLSEAVEAPPPAPPPAVPNKTGHPLSVDQHR